MANINAFLKRLATSNDTQTTALGLVAAAILAIQTDYGKVIMADPKEIAKAVGIVVLALFGYVSNKRPKGSAGNVPTLNVPSPPPATKPPAK